MPHVFIPPQLRSLTADTKLVEVDGSNVAEVIAQLEHRFPGIQDRLCNGNELRPGLTVAVGGSVATLGLLQRVQVDDEIHFLPAVGGG